MFNFKLADLVREDLQHFFPRLVASDVKITLIEALDHVLSMMVWTSLLFCEISLFYFLG